MAQPFERINENMGSPEAHVAIMRMRAENAKAEYESAVARGIPSQIETTKQEWEQRQREYEAFVSAHAGESPMEHEPTIQ
jgi:CCR4-NOT transcriptional regulation complex NOT5 subunit